MDVTVENATESPISKGVLGPNINTSKTELLPLASADRNTLYFSRANYLTPEADASLDQGFNDIAAPGEQACEDARGLAEEASEEHDRARLHDYAAAVCEDAGVRADALDQLRKIFRDHAHLPANIYRSERLADGTWTVAARMPGPFRQEFWRLLGQNFEDVWLSSALPDRNTLILSGPGLRYIDREYLELCSGKHPLIQAIEKESRSICPSGIRMPISRDQMGCFTGKTDEQGRPILLPLSDDDESRDRGYCLNVVTVHKTADGWQRGDPVIAHSRGQKRARIETAAMAPSGTTIIFSARNKRAGAPARPGEAQMDLYLTRQHADGTWLLPELLEDLNSPQHEQHPFIAADERSLYFASDRDGGEGGFDIWVTRRLDESWKRWSVPENLGASINSDEDETSLSVDATGRFAFMSAGVGEQQDIYEFGLPPGMRPAPVVLVQGQVLWLDASDLAEDPAHPGPLSGGGGVPIQLAGLELPIGSGSLQYREQSGATGGGSGGLSGTAGFDPGSGRFQMALPVGSSYAVFFEGMAGLGVSQTIDLRHRTAGGSLSMDLTIVPLCPGVTLPLNSIFFAVDKADLLPESEVELRRFAEILGSHPDMSAEIAGHTDSTNTDEYNQTLSESRAHAVFAWLTRNGSEAARLTARGYGESEPVATNETEEGRQKNRRVEFRILQMSKNSCRT
jgi:outer membrane protein OmpA-like peptidoglycan-associated protein